MLKLIILKSKHSFNLLCSLKLSISYVPKYCDKHKKHFENDRLGAAGITPSSPYCPVSYSLSMGHRKDATDFIEKNSLSMDVQKKVNKMPSLFDSVGFDCLKST